MKKIFFALLVFLITPTFADKNEISLLNSSGEAVVYIALDDELAIYTWDGDSVAYLHGSIGDFYSGNVMEVYGWNGNHLGWFFNGIVMNHYGDISCSTREKHPYPLGEDAKYAKYAKYPKYARNTIQEKPTFSDKFGKLDCQILMRSGSL